MPGGVVLGAGRLRDRVEVGADQRATARPDATSPRVATRLTDRPAGHRHAPGDACRGVERLAPHLPAEGGRTGARPRSAARK